MLNITVHAKERAIERLGFKEKGMNEKLNSLMENAVEVFCNGQGRAFENKQHGIVLITDIQKQNLVTVYHSKGNETSIDNTSSILEKEDIGIIKDVEFKNIIFKELEKKVLELTILDCELQLEISELEEKICELKLKALKSRKQEVFEKYEEELQVVSEKNNERRKTLNELSKRINKLIKDASEVFGFDLKQQMNSLKIKKRQFSDE